MRLLTILGAIVLVFWLLGSLGLIDFRLCIKLAGQCSAPSNPASTPK